MVVGYRRVACNLELRFCLRLTSEFEMKVIRNIEVGALSDVGVWYVANLEVIENFSE